MNADKQSEQFIFINGSFLQKNAKDQCEGYTNFINYLNSSKLFTYDLDNKRVYWLHSIERINEFHVGDLVAISFNFHKQQERLIQSSDDLKSCDKRSFKLWNSFRNKSDFHSELNASTRDGRYCCRNN